MTHMGGHQKIWSLFGSPNYKCSITMRIKKGIIILTTTHIYMTDMSICLHTCICASKEACMSASVIKCREVETEFEHKNE